MRDAANLHAELDGLRGDLHKSSGGRQAAAAPERARQKSDGQATAAPGDKTELEEQLRELGKVLSEYTGSIEDFVKEHQLASTLAAFLLGVAVGRLMGRG